MSALAHEIRREIERNGPITFAHFMQRALYTPGLGYYEQPRPIGRHGDFLTSVSTGPLFGQLLAFQFCEWIAKHTLDHRCQLVESGAYDGRLAVDILDWLSHFRSELLERLRYIIIEPSPTRKAWQEKNLSAHKSRVDWISGLESLASCEIDGIFFSNEFFDAFPVHRLAWSASETRWQEWHVTSEGEQFAWHLGDAEPNLPLLPVPPELASVLPNGFVTEIAPTAVNYWRETASKLRRGKLLAIDYGSNEFLRPDRPNGTLRAYYRHHPAPDLLANPGAQDITADVNFSALDQAGQTQGLTPAILRRQSLFLTEMMAISGQTPNFPSRQFQTLTHPNHLGHLFHFLIQSTREI